MPYSLSTHYAGLSLLDGFSFFTGPDPNGGRDAEEKDLVGIDEFDRVRLSVDSANTYSAADGGRPSVRLTSNKSFEYGLFIADFAHMPASVCGTWPAFWAFNNEADGANYPAGGEVDIIEGANAVERNLFSAHTEAGSPASDTSSYGNTFNAEGGGVYALEWDNEELKIWHFPRSAIPDDIVYAGSSASPEPETWGPPQAVFGGSDCDADTYFYNLSLVINTNFCGDYAGNTWGEFEECSVQAPTCEEFVAANPDSFLGSYWDINYIDVYTKLPIFPNATFPNTTFPNTTFPNTTASVSVLFPNATASATESSASGLDPISTPSNTRTVTLAIVSTTSAPLPEPTQSDGSATNPGTIDGYTLLGCFGSRGGFQPFVAVASLPSMDNEVCVSSCEGFKYAGVYDETCYCAGSLGDATPVDIDECDIPCPGNRLEFCGGLVDGVGDGGLPGLGGNGTVNGTLPTVNGTLPATGNSTLLALRHLYLQRRAAPTNILLTVYADLASDPLPAPAPGMGNIAPPPPPPVEEETTTTVTRVVTTAITVTYSAVCATDAARLIAVEYCTTATLTIEECASATADSVAAAAVVAVAMTTTTPPAAEASAASAAVPMCTVTETCDACGQNGESTVTLTVPLAVVTGGEDVVVTAIEAVQTVVPVPVVAATNVTESRTGGSNNATGGGGSGVELLPVNAGARATVEMGGFGRLGWSLTTAWLGLVGLFLML
ncbi:hypothetical protein SLS62_009995 [Diatrype stigma]|uniref:Uncharacterized protein n=1 Tax=Diatrype stigma TaxID=117547 RepID=A0AAN9UK11_9PEZI